MGRIFRDGSLREGRKKPLGGEVKEIGLVI